MPSELEPAEERITKLHGEVAVGEDLAFQRRWWTFERFMWSFFALLIAASLAGAFGRGPLANASTSSSDQSLRIDYERIERVSAPSMLTIHFRAHGEAHLHVSERVVRELGAKRIVPEPKATELSHGFAYTFPAEGDSTVELALEPTKPGVFSWEITLEDQPPLRGSVLVLP